MLFLIMQLSWPFLSDMSLSASDLSSQAHPYRLTFSYRLFTTCPTCLMVSSVVAYVVSSLGSS